MSPRGCRAQEPSETMQSSSTGRRRGFEAQQSRRSVRKRKPPKTFDMMMAQRVSTPRPLLQRNLPFADWAVVGSSVLVARGTSFFPATIVAEREDAPTRRQPKRSSPSTYKHKRAELPPQLQKRFHVKFAKIGQLGKHAKGPLWVPSDNLHRLVPCPTCRDLKPRTPRRKTKSNDALVCWSCAVKFCKKKAKKQRGPVKGTVPRAQRQLKEEDLPLVKRSRDSEDHVKAHRQQLPPTPLKRQLGRLRLPKATVQKSALDATVSSSIPSTPKQTQIQDSMRKRRSFQKGSRSSARALDGVIPTAVLARLKQVRTAIANAFIIVLSNRPLKWWPHRCSQSAHYYAFVPTLLLCIIPGTGSAAKYGRSSTVQAQTKCRRKCRGKQ